MSKQKSSYFKCSNKELHSRLDRILASNDEDAKRALRFLIVRTTPQTPVKKNRKKPIDG